MATCLFVGAFLIFFVSTLTLRFSRTAYLERCGVTFDAVMANAESDSTQMCTDDDDAAAATDCDASVGTGAERVQSCTAQCTDKDKHKHQHADVAAQDDGVAAPFIDRSSDSAPPRLYEKSSLIWIFYAFLNLSMRIALSIGVVERVRPRPLDR